MTEPSKAVHELSSRVMDSARKTGFALMKANYVERNAREFPGGKIQGLAPEARDIAVNLRDSIWSRFDSLRFHHNLMIRILESHRHQLPEKGHSSASFDAIWSASWHAHYLFDDVVFNSASLFDYLGNAVWFGFHGQNHIKKKWNKAYEAAKRPDLETRLPNGPRIFGSATGDLIREAQEVFLNDLYGYRSDLIHHHIDGPEVFSHRFWEESMQPGFQVPLPRAYIRRLRKLVPEMNTQSPEVDMVRGAEHLIKRIGSVSLDLLATLRDDLGWTEGEPLTML
jgi:hypothetical protein